MDFIQRLNKGLVFVHEVLCQEFDFGSFWHLMLKINEHLTKHFQMILKKIEILVIHIRNNLKLSFKHKLKTILILTHINIHDQWSLM